MNTISIIVITFICISILTFITIVLPYREYQKLKSNKVKILDYIISNIDRTTLSSNFDENCSYRRYTLGGYDIWCWDETKNCTIIINNNNILPNKSNDNNVYTVVRINASEFSEKMNSIYSLLTNKK